MRCGEEGGGKQDRETDEVEEFCMSALAFVPVNLSLSQKIPSLHRVDLRNR